VTQFARARGQTHPIGGGVDAASSVGSDAGSAGETMDARGDRMLEELCTRPLDHAPFPRVYLDVTYLKSRRRGQVVFEAIVAATGARTDGGLEILGIDTGDSEDADFWRRFLLSMALRGLGGVRVLGSDEHGGLEEALADVFPEARWTYSPGTATSIAHGSRRVGRTRGRPSTPRVRGWWAVPGARGHAVR